MRNLNSDITIRLANTDDIAQITQLYSTEVSNGIASFEEVPPTIDQMLQRYNDIVELGLPYLVACCNDNIVGYAYASRYRPRPAYRFTVENSIYIAPDYHGLGVGERLFTPLLEACEKAGKKQMIAAISLEVGVQENASVRFHKKMGFRTVGTIEHAGYKFERWLNTQLMQRAID